MAVKVGKKLRNGWEGALAGGGDPATSPLYVFGPFLKLLAAAGVTQIVYGASIWLAVLTVVVVSFMYRNVMRWVTDGSGGSGLNEEEFGPWAVKINASITFVEYTLTFLVSIAALVTFLSDRFPGLNESLLGEGALGGFGGGFSSRVPIAIILTLITAALVNLGPGISAAVFGPATAAVLVLLWVMIGATIWQRGLHFPQLNLSAFSSQHLWLTLGGYARILALMTGIEVFANLVAAYDGVPQEKSKKAFTSLVLIMGTTTLTMLIVGPAIRDLSDPFNPHVSVFTQTMDKLLPAQLSYLGTLTGVAVLLSAAAASAQGIQNLSLGLRYRHYLPAPFARRNRRGVSALPVWLMAVLISFCFFVFGTLEETYLTLYAAGVFVLLSLTGWAVFKRLRRRFQAQPSWIAILAVLGAFFASSLTTIATGIIVAERFHEGVWIYLLLIPILYLILGYYRNILGIPDQISDRIGKVLGGVVLPQPDTVHLSSGTEIKNILVPLDTSPFAEQVLGVVRTLARTFSAEVQLLTVCSKKESTGEVAQRRQGKKIALEPSGETATFRPGSQRTKSEDARAYLTTVEQELRGDGLDVSSSVVFGSPAEEIPSAAQRGKCDLIMLVTRERSLMESWMGESITRKVMFEITPPLLILRPSEKWKSLHTRFSRVIVTLDGSAAAEQVLPHAFSISSNTGSEVFLFSALEGNEPSEFRKDLEKYLGTVASRFAERGVKCEVQISAGESGTAESILEFARNQNADCIMMVSHGRGGVSRMENIRIGSVTNRVVQKTPCPVFMVSANPELGAKGDEKRPEDSSAQSSAGQALRDWSYEK